MQAQITLKTRDLETGEVVGEQSTTCATEDGQTFVIASGYLPGLADAPAEDVRVEILPPVQQVTFTAKSVTIDEAGNTVLSLTN